MKTDRLKLPCTDIIVTVNGVPVSFECQESDYNKYYLNDTDFILATGAMKILIDPTEYKAGDVIRIKSSAGNLESGGGDEDIVCAVGEVGEWVYGIGGPDTAYLEYCYGSLNGDITEVYSKGYKYHVLDYELEGVYACGLVYNIVQGIDNDRLNSGMIRIDVVWESREKEYAWDLVSMLTS